MRKKNIISLFIILFVFSLFSFLLYLYIYKPNIELIGEEVLAIPVNSSYQEEGAIADINKKDISNQIDIEGKVDNTKLGTYKIKYIIKKNNMTVTKTRLVKVVDTVKPIITINGNETINICPNQLFVEPGFKAIDNYDGDITSKVKIITTKNKITYEVEDSSKNKTSVTRTIVKNDNEKPSMTLSGKTSMSLVIGSLYYESGFKAIDNCDQDITSKVIISNKPNINKLGIYKISYEVEDSSGNKQVIYRTVKIIKPLPPKNSTIYLTFDDGPSNTTSKVLDILKEEKIKATFFVLNKSDSYNYLLKRIVSEGHTIALHGNTHNYQAAYASVENYFKDLTIISNKVKKVTGVDSKIIRFLGGSSNKVSNFNPGIMTILTNEVEKRGYRYYDWNITSIDTANITSSKVYNNVIKYLGSSPTYVVLMHDYEGNNKTVTALRDIIHYGKNNGYKFDKITEKTPQIKHNVKN